MPRDELIFVPPDPGLSVLLSELGVIIPVSPDAQGDIDFCRDLDVDGRPSHGDPEAPTVSNDVDNVLRRRSVFLQDEVRCHIIHKGKPLFVAVLLRLFEDDLLDIVRLAQEVFQGIRDDRQQQEVEVGTVTVEHFDDKNTQSDQGGTLTCNAEAEV